MNPEQEAVYAQAQAMLRRQQRALQTINDELAFSQNKLREMSKARDNLLARLFPAMRADRNSEHILAQLTKHMGESKDLQRAIVEQEAEISALEAESATDEIVTRLTQGRDNLLNLRRKLNVSNANVEHTRDIISPIRVLPPEILGYIFSYVEASRFSPPDETIPDIFAITHVCCSWRSIAINTPSLWSNLRITTKEEKKKPGWLSLIEMWLKRSKNHPLRFKLREGAKLGSNPTADCDFFRVLDLYNQHTQRWQSVSLTNPHFHLPGWLWFGKIPPTASCPILESLSIKCDVLEEEDVTKLEMLTSRSPQLRYLTWRYNAEPSHPAFPWAQLTHLELVSLIDLDEILQVLSSGTNLICADFTVQAHSMMVDNSLPHVVHPNLESLLLGISGDLSVLLDFLTLPKLKDLSVDILPPMIILVTLGGSNVPWKHDTFMSFLQRSQCKINTLSFLDVKFEPRELLAMLQSLSPSLVDFTMENVNWTCVTDEVLKALTYPTTRQGTSSTSTSTEEGPSTQGSSMDKTAILCPRLETVRFWGCMESTDGVLADMVESRLRHPKDSLDSDTATATLKMAHFGVHPEHVKCRDLERLEAIRRELGRDVGCSLIELDEFQADEMPVALAVNP